MYEFKELGSGEYVKISSRRPTYYLCQTSKGLIRRKLIPANTTLEVEINFCTGHKESGDHCWIMVSYPRQWRKFDCLIIRDWRIKQILHPRHHAHCLEYKIELHNFHQGKPTRLFDEDFAYTAINPDYRYSRD